MKVLIEETLAETTDIQLNERFIKIVERLPCVFPSESLDPSLNSRLTKRSFLNYCRDRNIPTPFADSQIISKQHGLVTFQRN